MNSTEVSITHPKGRPWLHWVGKKPPTYVKAYPAQLHDHFDPVGDGTRALPSPSFDHNDPWRNLLFYGDNKDVLAWLLANGYRGMVNLIYIDPPFDSGADYVRKVRLRGGNVSMEGEAYSLGEQVQYEDIWANDAYLQFMYERLILLKELLADDGSFWLHCDWHKGHQLRCLLDEVFGSSNLQNEVQWQRTDPHNDARSRLGWIHDTIYWYAKDKNKVTYNWKEVVTRLSEAALKEYNLIKLKDETIVPYTSELKSQGRRFKLDDCTYKGRDIKRQFVWRNARPSPKRVWPYASPEEMDAAVERGEFYLRDPLKGAARCRVSFLDEREGQVLQTIWTDCGRMKGGVEYPTQKPWALLARIIKASSDPGDLVLDCFLGSGTTVAVAQRLGRRWIGCDINKGAIQFTARRLTKTIKKQAEKLDLDPPPAATTFGLYYVNNYDLQLRHQDAQELVAEHIGLERTRSHAFFDGTLDDEWVKIVPFSRPLTLLDVEEVKYEIENDAKRDVVVVALGAEPRARQAITSYSRHLPRGSGRIRLIDLRTDERYGAFITHEPAEADVAIERDGENVIVEIRDFISPTIIKRLEIDIKELGVHPEIDDWRSMVDYVLIDPAYDGEVFSVRYADIPERKNDLVHGRYELPGVPPGSVVAVRIVDMLGEEVMPKPVTV